MDWMALMAYLRGQQQVNPALWESANWHMSDEIGRGMPQDAVQDVTNYSYTSGPTTTTVNTTVPPINFPQMPVYQPQMPAGGGTYGQPPPQQPGAQQPAEKKPKSKFNPGSPPPIWNGGVASGTWDTFLQKQGPEYNKGWGMYGAQKPMTQGFGGQA